MDLNDTPEEAKFRRSAREWLEENAPEDWRKRDLRARDPEGLQYSREWQRRKYAAGWSCIHWPSEFGGRDATPVERVIWAQEEGLLGLLSSVFIIGQGMCAPTLMVHARKELLSEHLPKLASGEEIWCQLFSEPDAGSDLGGLRARAFWTGNEWVVKGQKVWTSGAHYADYAILLARTDPEVGKHQGLTMFLLNMKTAGVTVKPIKQMSGHCDFNEVFLDNVQIPDENRLGEVGAGWGVALTTLMNERLAVGTAFPTNFHEMFNMACQIEGSNGALIKEKDVREKLAHWYVRSIGLRNIQYRMISGLSSGRTPGPEASVTKLILGINRQIMSSFMLDLLDSYGVVTEKDYVVAEGLFHAVFLRSAANRIEGGTDEILRNVIAERVLGLPGDIRTDKGIPFSKIPTGGD